MCMWDGGGDGPQVYSHKVVVARKQHACVECGRSIEVGERYHYDFQVYDGCPFIARLFEGFAENFPDLTDEHRQIVRDEIETAIYNEMSLGDLRFDESGLARIVLAIAAAFDRLVTDANIADRDDEH